MRLKKTLIFLAALLLCLMPMLAGADELRGYIKGQGWKFVQLGEYPYEKDGTVKPVLWRVLQLENDIGLLMTEYVIDTQQVIFETDQEKIKNNDYRRITRFDESDLYTWLNTVAIETLFGNSPVRDMLIEEPGFGKLFILTDEQFLDPAYGFSASRWGNQKTRHATGTPYAVKQRGLYVDHSNGKSPYWVATVRGADLYHLQLVGYNGHLSYGAYVRTNVGLRLSIRLDMSQLEVQGGAGTRQKPFVLVCTSEEPYVAEVTAVASPAPVATAEPTAAPTAEPTAVPTAVPTATPEPTVAPTAEPTAAPTAVPTATPEPTVAPTVEPTAAPKEEAAAQETPAEPIQDDELLLSFVGDCSIGDSVQYADYQQSYHNTIDEKGYAWPFSLVKEYLAADDLTIANLEVVLTERKSHSDKKYNMVGEPDHVNVLLEGSVEMVNTVNNHCMDFHRSGYLDTLATLDAAGIDRFGSTYVAQKDGFDDLAVQEIDGIRIGFMGFSYPQQSDKQKIANRVRILKEEQGCDLVVVSLHWGRETYAQPDSGQVVFAKAAIDAGADVIWGHHPHVIQPINFYKGKPIMYSTGNFTFGTMSKVDPATGIFQLAYERVDGQVQLKRLQVIPCETQGSPDYRPFVLTDEEARKAVFKKLRMKKNYAKCEDLPDSFLETGIVYFENGEMLP